MVLARDSFDRGPAENWVKEIALFAPVAASPVHFAGSELLESVAFLWMGIVAFTTDETMWTAAESILMTDLNHL